MYFDLKLGTVTDGTKHDCFWFADDLVFYSVSNMMFSFELNSDTQIKAIELRSIGQMFQIATSNHDYIEHENDGSPFPFTFFALEECDGTDRNWVIDSGKLRIIINLRQTILKNLGKFFLDEAERILQ